MRNCAKKSNVHKTAGRNLMNKKRKTVYSFWQFGGGYVIILEIAALWGGSKRVMNLAEPQYVIEMLNITKEFPGIRANDNITLQLRRGEIHALLGENGAGKSTLMSVLFGLYQPESGVIKKMGRS